MASARILCRLALGLALALAPLIEAWAQGIDIMRSTNRAVERALSGQVARALRPQLTVRGLYEQPPRAMALAGDGGRLALVTGDGGLRVHDIAAGVEVLRRDPRGAGLAGVAIAPDGVGLAVLGTGGEVRSGRGATLADEPLPLPGAPASAIAFAAGGLAIGHRDGAVTVIAPATRDVIARAPATGSPVTALAPGAGGVIAGHADGALRRLGSGGDVAALPAAGAGVTALAPAWDGLIAAGSADGRARLIDPQGARVIEDWRAHASGAVAIAAGHDRVVTGGAAGGAILWDEDGDEEEVLLAPGAGPVTAVALARADGRLRALSAGPDTAVMVFDEDAERRVTLYPTRRGWGAVDRRGRFDGNESAFEDLAWAAERLRLPVERYAQGYFEPGLVYKHLLGGDRFLTAAEAVVTEGIPRPPEAALAIEARPDGAGGTIRLSVTGEAEAPLGVAAIRLFQNGKRIGQAAALSEETAEDGGRTTRRISFALPAVAGENRLTAIVRDGAGIDSAPAEAVIEAARAPAPGRMHLTAIGIDRYANSALDLNYAVADARGVAERLSARAGALFGGVERDLVLDSQATRAGIAAALDRLDRTRPEDAAVVFLAGHAVTLAQSWYFLGQELTAPKRPGHVQEVGLSGEDLVAALVAAPARRLLLVIDACHAGAVLGPFERFAQRRALVSLEQETGVTVIAATRADQEAPEFPRLGHGLMTYVLLQGLAPGPDGALQADTDPRDGRITADELRRFVERTVPAVQSFLDESLGRGPTAGPAGGVTPVGLSLGANFDLAR